MNYVADTNILLWFCQEGTSDGLLARDAAAKLWNDGSSIYITPQNIVEFWNVATRPTNVNGLGLSPEEADLLVQALESIFPLLPDGPAIHDVWRKLVLKERVRGANVHDARLSAALKTHNIDRLITFNKRHFSRFGIVAYGPSDILANTLEN